MARAVKLFLDFDNTITKGDVLDLVIERYSVTQRWREWEAEWRAGRMTTAECLRRQVGDLRVTADELIRFTDAIEIDKAFAPLVSWARAETIETAIVSDNFGLVIEAMLRRRKLPLIPIYANRLTFELDRPQASFPLRDLACARCAHCKAQHLRGSSGHVRVFVGDGLSDICPALIADVLFAKDSLAAELQSMGIRFHPFDSLADVLGRLQRTASVDALIPASGR